MSRDAALAAAGEAATAAGKAQQGVFFAPAEAQEILREFEARLSYPLDDFQRSACERLVAGRSVLVAAPTGSGKTTVAEFAVALAVRELNQRIFYTAPIKALSNQKFRELVEEYGEDAVGLLTGDVNLRGDAPIVVMTTEVLRNMVYENSSALSGLGFVVLDEVHFLGDRFRGAVWEEVILHLPRQVRIVGLSATVSNAEEFGDWLHEVRGETDVIISERRPVPLFQLVLTDRAVLPLYVGRDGELAQRGRINPELYALQRGVWQGSEVDGLADAADSGRDWRDGGRGRGRSDVRDDRGGRRGNRGRGDRGSGGREHGGREHEWDGVEKHFGPSWSREKGRMRGGAPRRRARRLSHADIARSLAETGLLPALVFVFSRQGCEQAVQQCVWQGFSCTSKEERREIRRIALREIEKLSPAEQQVVGARAWLAGLERGVAAHHAGLLPAFKAVVEELFQNRLVKLVFATETLALGINMPAKAVVLERLDKFNGVDRVPLTSGEYTQLTGRAGRRGIDVEGHALIVWRDGLRVDEIAALAGARSFPVNSTFRPTASMTVNLLRRMSRQQVAETLELSFAQFQADRSVVSHAREIRKMADSLAGYQAAAARASGAAQQRWERRAKKLERDMQRLQRGLTRRTGYISRVFERVAQQLLELGYLAAAGDSAGSSTATREVNSAEKPELRVTAWGEVLCGIYGERDLLVAECLRQGLLNGCTPLELVAFAAFLSYEPKREREYVPYFPGGNRIQGLLDKVLVQWLTLDDQADRLLLPHTAPPHAGLVRGMYLWAQGSEVNEVLALNDLPVGDFVRSAKQTIDLLQQLARGLAELPDVKLPASQLAEISANARKAKNMLVRGIVATAMQY